MGTLQKKYWELKDLVEIHLGVRDVSASGDRALLLWQRAKLTPTPLHSLVCCEKR